MKKRILYDLESLTCRIAVLVCLGLFILLYGCASNKASRVGGAAGKAAIGGVPSSAAGAVDGGATTALSGGKVFQGVRQGAASGVGNAAGATTGTILRELMK